MLLLAALQLVTEFNNCQRHLTAKITTPRDPVRICNKYSLHPLPRSCTSTTLSVQK